MCLRSWSLPVTEPVLKPRQTDPRPGQTDPKAHRLHTQVTAPLRQEAKMTSLCLAHSTSSIHDSPASFFHSLFPDLPFWSMLSLQLDESDFRRALHS